MLADGACLEEEGKDRPSALHAAVSSGKEPVANLRLGKGADVSVNPTPQTVHP